VYVAECQSQLGSKNGTIQENIFLGQPMDPEIYKEVRWSCCLAKDLEMMDFGD
jgi:hypothetical protein